MATENLKVKITADASQAKAEIGKFKNSLKETISASESAAGAVSKLKVALAGLDALKVAKAMISNAVAVAAQGDAIKDNAQKVFMGTTAYQEWGYVLQQNGVEMSTLKVGMRQFAQQVAAGTPALAKYGITAQDVDTAFQQAVSTIQNMNSETEKIAAATELFGSRALELMPVLNLTNAETQSLMNTYRAIGGTMSNELIAASDVCTDSITEMRAAWGGLRNVLAAYVIPVVTKVVQWITVAIAKIRILLAAFLGVKETFGGGGKKSLPATSGRVAVNTGNIGKNLKKASKHAKELKRTLMGIDELSRLAEQATAAAAGGSGGGGGGGGGGVDVGDIAGATDSLFSDETLEKIEKFRKKIEGVKDLLNGFYLILKGLVEIALGNWAKGWDDIKAGIEKVWNYLKTNFPFLEKVEAAFKKIKETWDKFKANPKEFIAELKDRITEKFNKLKKWWDEKKAKAKEFLTEFKDKVSEKFNKLKKWWDEKKADAKVFATEFKEGVKTKWDKLKKWWDGKKASAKEFKAEFLNKVKDKWDKFKKWWDGIKGGNKEYTVKFGFVDKLKSAWNGLADKVNGARAKSKIAAELLPAIPKLARGGILDAPTLAVMGEYPGARSNPEIATPQSLMYETMQKANGDLVSAFASMTRQVIAAIENKDLDVRIGDEQIARSAQRGNIAYRNRTGKALI